MTDTTAHAHHGYITDKEKYLNRMRRIEGQARGIHKMVELQVGEREPTRQPGTSCRWCPLSTECPEGRAHLAELTGA